MIFKRSFKIINDLKKIKMILKDLFKDHFMTSFYKTSQVKANFKWARLEARAQF